MAYGDADDLAGVEYLGAEHGRLPFQHPQLADQLALTVHLSNLLGVVVLPQHGHPPGRHHEHVGDDVAHPEQHLPGDRRPSLTPLREHRQLVNRELRKCLVAVPGWRAQPQ
jgi:hypothetical protein